VSRIHCASSLSADSLRCHFGKEGSRPYHVYEPLPGMILSQLSSVNAEETQLLASSVVRLWHKVYLIRCGVSCMAARENPPLAISDICKERRMSECSRCTRPPCLAIVAAMLKTYWKLVAVSAKCKSVQKQHAMLPDTLGDLTGASMYF